MNSVLHITPHLGGGIGRALSGLLAQPEGACRYEHAVVCLETPEKSRWLDEIIRAGCRVYVRPSHDRLLELLLEHDIAQVEFWNHPATVRFLCEAWLPPLRVLLWCHISGLHHPRIPRGLASAVARLVLTSPCSLAADEVQGVPTVAVVSSGAGFEQFPVRRFEGSAERRPRVGYVGSLNFAKLHPDFVTLAGAVGDLETVRMIGDEVNRELLESACRALGRPGLLDFAGFVGDVVHELAQLDILLYLLNPYHYGTAENSLLEAMAMGVVPVVLANPAEMCIVEDGVTGVVVRSAVELEPQLTRLIRDHEWRQAMAAEAAARVRTAYSAEGMRAAMDRQYDEALRTERRKAPFVELFGETPASWFQSFCATPEMYRMDGTVTPPRDLSRHIHTERTKGSALHFRDHYPDDPLLQSWARALAAPSSAHVH